MKSDGVPLVVHNIGAGAREEDILFRYTIIGHYRLPPTGRRSRPARHLSLDTDASPSPIHVRLARSHMTAKPENRQGP